MKKLQEIKFTIAIVTFVHLISSKTVLSQNGNFTCVTSGRFPNAEDCSKYYFCVLTSGTMYLQNMTCPNNLLFDSISQYCTNPANATCGSTPTPIPTTPTPNSCVGPGFFCNSDTTYTYCADVNVPILPGNINCPSGYFCNPKCSSPCLNQIALC
ncbi:hypothetical protein L798_01194 [Zootermopsis nevadensis]|uniref:Chitin-binding type-2 domain-containing protein n=1 Tax=Zootermopsis nevadensis TaxID=136037 RepID=A0A067REL1_ZOONE|nr:hypothetical protein L798_01194 [Zootermopsis nevadensis]